MIKKANNINMLRTKSKTSFSIPYKTLIWEIIVVLLYKSPVKVKIIFCFSTVVIMPLSGMWVGVGYIASRGLPWGQEPFKFRVKIKESKRFKVTGSFKKFSSLSIVHI